jgi:hypothetical protein
MVRFVGVVVKRPDVIWSISAAAEPPGATAAFTSAAINTTPVHSKPTTPANMAMSIDQKRLRATKFPPEFDKKVDIEKVNIDLIKKWIANKITDILGDEDDIVVETCYNLIEQTQFVGQLCHKRLRPLTFDSRKLRRFRSSSRAS